MFVLRRVLLVVIAAAAVAVTLLGVPEEATGLPGPGAIRDHVRAALAIDDANQALTESAPQQSAANGWVARDLLAVIANAEADQLWTAQAQAGVRDDRPVYLLALAVLALCVIGATSPRTDQQPSAAVVPVPPPGDDNVQ